ncbi:MFS transporter [Gordonia polyisoprenivorans]|uniref:MFS transporter n=1 Tax=Gordonia polyisoprenivorans TaxID=84595 RepID=UPI0019E32AFA|nr:MFS transporter [Gordonia polyisoprenivorans]UZF55271.1 MFS transporter [Gordonia polyisoprenivorans]
MARKWWTLVVVCAATFMLLLDVTIVVVALPDIEHALGASFSQLQWVTDAYALALASLLLTSGSISDKFGRRRIFSIGLVIFTLGSLLCGVAQDPTMLIVSRALQGIGGAMLFATSLALLAATFHGRERGLAFGAWGAVTGIATALGPILGGVLTTGITWRAIFLVNLPIGIVALYLTLRMVDESRSPHARRIDWPGVLTFTAGLLVGVYGLTEAGQRSWTDGLVLGCFAAAAVLLVAFVIVELRVAQPMFDLGLLRIPTFGGGLIAAFTMNGSLFAMLLYLVLYLQNSLGFSALETGLRLLVMSGCTMIFATIAGRLSEHMPVRWLIGPGLVLVGGGLFAMAGLEAGSSWTHLIPGLVIAGIGSGLVNPPLAATAVGVVPVHRSGMASGINTTFRQIGIAVGIAVYGSLFSSRMTSSMHDNLTGGIHAAYADGLNLLFWVSGVVAVLGGVCALVMIRSKDFVPHGPAPVVDDEPEQVPAG